MTAPRTPRLKRAIAKLALFVALGAIINIAVAWGCLNWAILGPSASVFVEPSNRESIEDAGEMIEGTARMSTAFGVRCIVADLYDPIGLEELREIWQRVVSTGALVEPTPGPFSWVERYEAGWPAGGVSARIWFHSKTYCTERSIAWPQRRLRIEGGIPVGNGAAVATMPVGHRIAPLSVVRVLPLVPLWPSFAINTIFYAAILWVLFTLPLAIRKRRRIARRLCPACAYPIGEHGRCTECGAPVPHRVAAR